MQYCNLVRTAVRLCPSLFQLKMPGIERKIPILNIYRGSETSGSRWKMRHTDIETWCTSFILGFEHCVGNV